MVWERKAWLQSEPAANESESGRCHVGELIAYWVLRCNHLPIDEVERRSRVEKSGVWNRYVALPVHLEHVSIHSGFCTSHLPRLLPFSQSFISMFQIAWNIEVKGLRNILEVWMLDFNSNSWTIERVTATFAYDLLYSLGFLPGTVWSIRERAYYQSLKSCAIIQ